MNQARQARPPRLDEGAMISVRLATSGDDDALEQLAALSERVKSHGRWLIAEVDGQVWAAHPLAGGEALADPFLPTAELRALLSLRAKQLGAADASFRGSSNGRRRRFRSTPAFADQTPLC
jgi:hypothetical protein